MVHIDDSNNLWELAFDEKVYPLLSNNTNINNSLKLFPVDEFIEHLADF